MKIKLITKKERGDGGWQFYAMCNADGTCPLLEWLSGLNKKYSGSIKRIKTILDICTENPEGPRLLPVEISHDFDADNSLFEFVAGDLRVVWFYSKKMKAAVICILGFIKKGLKADRTTRQLAIKLKKDFASAESSTGIEVIE